MQAFICTTIWRPVDPEVEDHLALETTVVTTSGEHSRRVRPPYGYGLLRAKQEARKARTLRSHMKVSLKKGINLWHVAFFHLTSICLLLALCVPAAVSAVAADGKLPGQGRAVPGQVAALCNQTRSPHSTVRNPEPHRTHGVRTTFDLLLPNRKNFILKWVSLSFRCAAGQMSINGSTILWCHIYTKILCSVWWDYHTCSTHKLSVLRRASSWETLLWQDSWR